MPFYERQPYIQPLHQLVAEVTAGEVRVPLFQRPESAVTWRPEQRGDLLDSVYRGFPIGMILLWSTRSAVGTYPGVGPFMIPDGEPGRVQRLLLDGHQRLSTLVAILGRGLASELNLITPPVGPDEERWVFDVNQPSDGQPDEGQRSRDRFVLLKPNEQPSDTQIAFDIALNRLTLNEWIRKRPQLDPRQVRLLDGLRDRFREYTIPVAVLAAETLDEATESFKRINSSGTAMGPFHMVAARAYGAGFDLQALFKEHIQETLEPLGWGEVDETDLLRVCVGLDPKANPLKLDVEGMAERLKLEPTLVPRAVNGAGLAARVLASFGVHGPGSLPYSYQFVALAIFTADRIVDPTQRERDAMETWFWLTTYGEVFAGVNSAIFDRARAALRAMVEGGRPSSMGRDLTRVVSEPQRFDFRSARARACALAMARFQDQGNRGGAAHRALARDGVSALETLRGNRSDWWSRVIVPHESLSALRVALGRVAIARPEAGDSELLESIGFPPAATGDLDQLLRARREFLAEKEREFVGRLPDIQWEV